MKILFMGTPDFAVFSLDALTEAGEDIIAVVTQTDKPQGRGYVLTPSAVKRRAQELSIPVYQPKTLRDEAFAELLSALKPEMIVVAAYGKILPENVINYPKYGCINVHGSYLPKYRGAAPMQRAIIDGEEYTGVTIMYMDVGLDTGDMLAREKIAIGPDDDFEVIHDRIGKTGAALLVKTINDIKDGRAVREKQDDSLSTYAAKISKEDRLIDFSLPAKKVHDLVRGLSPVPLAQTFTEKGRLLKIVKTAVSDNENGNAAPGTVVSVDGGRICVACGEGCVDILTLIPEGKSKMSAADFVRGRGISVGEVLCRDKK